MLSKSRKLFASFGQKYEALPGDSTDSGPPNDGLDDNIRKHQRSRIILYCLGFSLVNLVFGFFLGRWSSSISFDDYLQPTGNTVQIWRQNDTFSSKPTPESEAAWQSLVPKGRGFILHPTLAPTGKSISTFHELHCLHGIQIGYYQALYNITLLHIDTNTTIPVPEYIESLFNPNDTYILSLKAKTHPDHIAHCFDYLRQALMCAADTNLEIANKTTGATNGWGFERKCRDYSAVFRWAEKWRVSDGRTILGSENQDQE